MAADEYRSCVKTDELHQHRHHILRLEAPSHADRQPQTALLMDHVKGLQSSAIGGGIELEVDSPHLVGEFGLMMLNGAIGGAGTLLLARSEPLESLLPRKVVHPIAIHPAALAPQHEIRHPLTPAGSAAIYRKHRWMRVVGQPPWRLITWTTGTWRARLMAPFSSSKTRKGYVTEDNFRL